MEEKVVDIDGKPIKVGDIVRHVGIDVPMEVTAVDPDGLFEVDVKMPESFAAKDLCHYPDLEQRTCR